jgi:hypothetical protein
LMRFRHLMQLNKLLRTPSCCFTWIRNHQLNWCCTMVHIITVVLNHLVSAALKKPFFYSKGSANPNPSMASTITNWQSSVFRFATSATSARSSLHRPGRTQIFGICLQCKRAKIPLLRN